MAENMHSIHASPCALCLSEIAFFISRLELCVTFFSRFARRYFFPPVEQKKRTARARMHNENDIQFLIDFGPVMMLDALFSLLFRLAHSFCRRLVVRFLSIFQPLHVSHVLNVVNTFFFFISSAFFSPNYSCITKDHKINFDHRE